jgi:hypothetical protein
VEIEGVSMSVYLSVYLSVCLSVYLLRRRRGD